MTDPDPRPDDRRPIRVVLAEDHQSIREALVMLLRARKFDVVGVAVNGAEALALVAEHQPDIVLLDLRMPVVSGLEATKAVRRDHPDVRVVVVSASAQRERIEEVFVAGAIGFVVKDAAWDDLPDAITAALAGERFVSPQILTSLGPLSQRRS